MNKIFCKIWCVRVLPQRLEQMGYREIKLWGFRAEPQKLLGPTGFRNIKYCTLDPIFEDCVFSQKNKATLNEVSNGYD